MALTIKEYDGFLDKKKKKPAKEELPVEETVEEEKTVEEEAEK